jgi:nucleotide-binding universal stress UspA family protein
MQTTDNIPQVGMSHPVLVPVDFSACSQETLIYAARMTADTRTPLLVLHVIHDSGNDPGFYRRHHGDNPLLPIADIASKMLDDWLFRIRKEEPELGKTLKRARLRLVDGLPGRRIVEVATAEHALMIVMGTHGRSGLSHLLRGSVTEYVMKHATVPVTTLREGIDASRRTERLKYTTLMEGAVSGDH